ncbi:MAG TPA: EAL domain-containing protein, partial [Burkholderiaceae bacterium]|nr:EAL domain-containing protein [Burkholderiaceae bacterium]
PLGTGAFLSAPVRSALDLQTYVPLQVSVLVRDSYQPVTLGALIPISKLGEAEAAMGKHVLSRQSLYLLDGRVLMRSAHQHPYLAGVAPESASVARKAASQAAGEFEAKGSSGAGLAGAYLRSESYPYIAASAQASESYLAPWRQRTLVKTGVLLLFLLLLGGAGLVLLRTQASLATSSSVYRRLFEDVADSVMYLTPTGEIKGLNAAALRLTGNAEASDVVGRSVFDFIPRNIDTQTGQPSTLALERFARALAGERLRFEYSFDGPASKQRVDCDIRLSAFETAGEKFILLVMRDITDERRHVRQQEYLANHDVLTGLPNRYSLVRTLERHIENTPAEPLQLLLINLVRFKEINESFGHRTGDTMLEVVAQRLAKSLEDKGWSLARLGGTDLVALRRNNAAAAVEIVAPLILKAAGDPIGISDTSVSLQALLGATRYPDDALDASQLLRCAEVATARAKAEGAYFAWYGKEFDHSPGHDLKMRAELSTAIREGQLQLAYQPKVWLEGKELAGVEALLRWNHPKRGWISPMEFIPLAESTELIHPLTRWVIGEAMEQILLWQKQGRPLKVAVNISTNNLQDPDFTEYVKDLLQRKGVPAELLELEITEGALARNPEIVLRRLQDLRATGLGLSLDDFGTGFSSLSYVSQFPFTSIKIDKSFVSALLSSPRDRQVAESTISLGRKLDLQTIAEGVEDDATASALLALECDIAQGYLFAKPMLATEFEAWRAEHEAMLAEARREALASPRL